jgi:sulfatase maturation enzyme AslB (radical SAM superfamily)
MKRTEALAAWSRILRGHFPAMSIEIARECPLRCPGCYAYEPDHLQNSVPLRSLADFKGQELIDRILELVRRHRPIHISIVGGEPLIRFRELNTLLPQLAAMRLSIQVVTSAVRSIPREWSNIPRLQIVVSIDGLQPEHDQRRKPATYERILENIEGHRITIHCTVTAQMCGRSGYFEEFARFWSVRPEVNKIWFSLFTPQMGSACEEILTEAQRDEALSELAGLRDSYPKIALPDLVIDGYRNPPKSPSECIFARTTMSITADLKSRVMPCQFGGSPDCSHCGCLASAGLKAIGDHRLFGVLPLYRLYNASDRVGKTVAGIVQRRTVV